MQYHSEIQVPCEGVFLPEYCFGYENWGGEKRQAEKEKKAFFKSHLY